MRIDFSREPQLADRWMVIDCETGNPIEDLAWADNETGIYATVKKRPRMLTDPPGTDLRIRSGNGSFELVVHRGEIEFVDRNVNPFKSELLMLLDDAEIIAKLLSILQKSLIHSETSG